MPTSSLTVVLVPGGFLGPWIWEPVETLLGTAELDTVTMELASVPMSDDVAVGDLYADAAALRGLLDGIGAAVLLCGHSYGGAVISEAGSHPAVERLVYLAAAAPDAGESLADLAPPPQQGEGSSGDSSQAEQVEFRSDGMIRLTPDAAVAGLFHDCDRDTATSAVVRLRPMNPEVNSQPVGSAAWRHLPTTYVRCTHDRIPELATTTFLETVEDVVELPTGHCPQWSRPDLVADVLAQRARGEGRR